MRSFHQSKRSDNKQYAVEVRWGIVFFRIWIILLFLRAVVNIPIQTLIIAPLLCKMIISQLELGLPVVLVANMAVGRCTVNNINQQFAYTRLSKIAQMALTFWLQEKIICLLNMKKICFEVFVWYKREFECFGDVFLNLTCKSRWSRNALLEHKYAHINRSKNS